MIIYRKSTRYGERYTVRLTRRGIVTTRERPKAGGGYYVRETMTAPWREGT